MGTLYSIECTDNTFWGHKKVLKALSSNYNTCTSDRWFLSRSSVVVLETWTEGQASPSPLTVSRTCLTWSITDSS